MSPCEWKEKLFTLVAPFLSQFYFRNKFYAWLDIKNLSHSTSQHWVRSEVAWNSVLADSKKYPWQRPLKEFKVEWMLWPRWSQVKTKARALLLSVCSPAHCLVMFFPVKAVCNLRRRATTLLPPTVYKIYLYLSFGGRNLSPFSFTKWVWLPTSQGRKEILQSRHSCISLSNKWKENLGNNRSFLKICIHSSRGNEEKRKLVYWSLLGKLNKP